VLTGRDPAALLNIPRDLLAPQYSVLNSLLAGYNDRSEQIATGGSSSLSAMANEAVAQAPVIGSLLNAIAKQGKEPLKGGDPQSLSRFVKNQGWIPSNNMMFPSTNYNPANWERSNAIISNEELKSYETSLKKPNVLEQVLGNLGRGVGLDTTMGKPVPVPLHSQEQLAAHSYVKDLQGTNEADNKNGRIQYDIDEKVKRFIYNYDRAEKSGDKTKYSRYDKRTTPLTPQQWELMSQLDPEAYQFYYYTKGYGKKNSKPQKDSAPTLEELIQGLGQ
jgi:hypothetical protein